MRKIPALIISGLLTASVLSGASSQSLQKSHRNPAPVHLSWYMDTASESPLLMKMQGDGLRALEQSAGVTITRIASVRNRQEQLDAMAAADRLPDMLTMDMQETYTDQLIRRKKVFSLKELEKQYLPGFLDPVPAGVMKDTAFYDGVAYGIPEGFRTAEDYRDSAGRGQWAFFVHQQLYRSLGQPMMRTPGEMEDVLIRVRDHYRQAGVRNGIPLMLYVPGVAGMEPLEQISGIPAYLPAEDHSLQMRYRSPRYPEFIVWMNRLYRQQVLAPLAFFNQKRQNDEALLEGRTFLAVMRTEDALSINRQLLATGKGFYYQAVEPPSGETSLPFTGRVREGRTLTIVTRQSAHPGAAARVLSQIWQLASQELPQKIQENTPQLQQLAEEATRIADSHTGDNTTLFRSMNPDGGLPAARILTQTEDIIARNLPQAVMAESADNARLIFSAMCMRLEQAGCSRLEDYWTNLYQIRSGLRKTSEIQHNP